MFFNKCEFKKMLFRSISLGVLLVIILIPLTQVFAQQFDPLEELNNSTILVDGKTLVFSNNDIEIRQFSNSNIVKIQGQASTGEILIIFLKNNDPNFQKVMVIFDGQFHKGTLIPKIYTESKVETTQKDDVQYIPNLMMTSSHNFTNYWKETFNIDVQAFDGKINSNPTLSSFEGRIDGVDVEVHLSLDGLPIAILSGVTTNNGHWDGAYYIQERLAAPGEYIVDVTLSYRGETVSKSSTMVVIASTSSSSNTPP